MFQTVFAKLRRGVVLQLIRFLPLERRRAIDRWLRGREQFRRLRRADVVVVSPGKSGRTWLRVMLSGYYHHAYGLSGTALLGFDNLHRKDARIPRIFFTHDNYLKDYTGNRDSKRDFYDKKVVLMVRQPQDVVVSEYLNWRYRMKPGKMYLNDFPPRSEDVSVFDFAMRSCGLVRILDLMNLWAREMDRVKDLLLVRYEDMRSDPEAVFRSVVRFLGESGSGESIRAAVEFASLENMRQMEREKTFWLGGGRMKPADPSNPQSYKVRRAKVGGYRDHFDEAQVARLDELVNARLDPVYGYGKDAGISAPAGA
ncbi:MAG: sulfotransferase domain-containing protein [Planctomycetota bacterium]|jgi:hypothetical protein